MADEESNDRQNAADELSNVASLSKQRTDNGSESSARNVSDTLEDTEGAKSLTRSHQGSEIPPRSDEETTERPIEKIQEREVDEDREEPQEPTVKTEEKRNSPIEEDNADVEEIERKKSVESKLRRTQSEDIETTSATEEKLHRQSREKASLDGAMTSRDAPTSDSKLWKRQFDKPRRQSRRQFRAMMGQRETRNEELKKREDGLRERLDMLECSMPAAMVWNVWRMAQDAPITGLRRMVKKQFQGPAFEQVCCPSTPSRHYDCRVREAEAERKQARKRMDEARTLWLEKEATLNERREKLEEAKATREHRKVSIKQLTEESKQLRESLDKINGVNEYSETDVCGGDVPSCESCCSIKTLDVEYLEHLEELAEAELSMKKQIAELERREDAYMRALQQAEDLWSKMEGDTVSTVSALQEQLETKMAANQQLADRICQLEDELEKLRAKMANCRTELEKYIGVDRAELAIGRDGDMAWTDDKAAGILPEQTTRTIGREDDYADVTDEESLAKALQLDKEAMAMDDTDYDAEKLREMKRYLTMLDSAEELYYPDDYGVCEPKFVCNDAVLTDTGMNEEELAALGVTPSEALDLLRDELLAKGTDSKVYRRERTDVETSEVTSELTEGAKVIEQRLVDDRAKRTIKVEEPITAKIPKKTVETTMKERDKIAEKMEIKMEEPFDPSGAGSDSVPVPRSELRSWLFIVDTIRSTIPICDVCNSLEPDVDLLFENIQKYIGMEIKEIGLGAKEARKEVEPRVKIDAMMEPEIKEKPIEIAKPAIEVPDGMEAATTAIEVPDTVKEEPIPEVKVEVDRVVEREEATPDFEETEVKLETKVVEPEEPTEPIELEKPKEFEELEKPEEFEEFEKPEELEELNEFFDLEDIEEEVEKFPIPAGVIIEKDVPEKVLPLMEEETMVEEKPHVEPIEKTKEIDVDYPEEIPATKEEKPHLKAMKEIAEVDVEYPEKSPPTEEEKPRVEPIKKAKEIDVDYPEKIVREEERPAIPKETEVEVDERVFEDHKARKREVEPFAEEDEAPPLFVDVSPIELELVEDTLDEPTDKEEAIKKIELEKLIPMEIVEEDLEYAIMEDLEPREEAVEELPSVEVPDEAKKEVGEEVMKEEEIQEFLETLAEEFETDEVLPIPKVLAVEESPIEVVEEMMEEVESIPVEIEFKQIEEEEEEEPVAEEIEKKLIEEEEEPKAEEIAEKLMEELEEIVRIMPKEFIPEEEEKPLVVEKPAEEEKIEEEEEEPLIAEDAKEEIPTVVVEEEKKIPSVVVEEEEEIPSVVVVEEEEEVVPLEPEVELKEKLDEIPDIKEVSAESLVEKEVEKKPFEPIDPRIVDAPYLAVADIEEIEGIPPIPREKAPCVCRPLVCPLYERQLPRVRKEFVQTEIVRSAFISTETQTILIQPRARTDWLPELSDRDPEISAPAIHWRKRPKDRFIVSSYDFASQRVETTFLVETSPRHAQEKNLRDSKKRYINDLLNTIELDLSKSDLESESDVGSSNYSDRKDKTTKCDCSVCEKEPLPSTAPWKKEPKIPDLPSVVIPDMARHTTIQTPMARPMMTQTPIARSMTTQPRITSKKVAKPTSKTTGEPANAKRFHGDRGDPWKEPSKETKRRWSPGESSKGPKDSNNTPKTRDTGPCSCSSPKDKPKTPPISRKGATKEKKDQSCLARISRRKPDQGRAKDENRAALTRGTVGDSGTMPSVYLKKSKPKVSDDSFTCLCVQPKNGRSRKRYVCGCGDSD